MKKSKIEEEWGWDDLWIKLIRLKLKSKNEILKKRERVSGLGYLWINLIVWNWNEGLKVDGNEDWDSLW